MEEKELMLGDLICYDHPIRICALLSAGILYCERYISYEALSPIPLTEEMLINNGFEDSGKYLRLQDDVLMIHREGGKLWVIIGTWAIDIQYVHKLQHLLRFCGLNDLANEFKIE